MKQKNNKWYKLLIAIGFILTIATSCNKTDKTNKQKEVGTVTDIDGNIYQTIKIGNQVWMNQNLNTKNFNDNDSIPFIEVPAEGGYFDYYEYPTLDSVFESINYAACCLATTSTRYIDDYLRYNWYAVNSGKLCPKGWHIPSIEEWNILIDTLNHYKTYYNEDINCNENELGFYLPLSSGIRSDIYGTWSRTFFNENLVKIKMENWNNYNETNVPKNHGAYVRCIKD